MTEPRTAAGRDYRAELRAVLDEIIEGTEPDRIGQYEPLKKWVHRNAKEARAALAAEAAEPAPLDWQRIDDARQYANEQTRVHEWPGGGWLEAFRARLAAGDKGSE